ncbi:hypothetical protein VC83_01058 [Pseudogymnoascus destructans]|uniref:DDE-1 domain-containing protein n=1 Tax=Pseudogymnoascus destructans TaxID=655981 RepID=A0A177AJJ8_9PEZI|nr:uncharacterized protein VC83_01058 [Pseudogymnoascus destructans]OAF62228.1 hypothetical protein VC83_01058 [Pseudogymnoascus destructans]
MDGATKPVLDAWFDAYQKVVQEHGIDQKDIYNMDESGFSIGTMKSTRIMLRFLALSKKRLTAALSHLNQAQLVRIQKYEWMEAYIRARSDVCNRQNIESAWRGAGLIPFNPQRALRTMARDATPEQERPRTPTQFDIFNQVFVNSSPPDPAILRDANKLLNSTIKDHTTVATPVRRYIQKLTTRV